MVWCNLYQNFDTITMTSNVNIPNFRSDLIMSEATKIAKSHTEWFWDDSVKTVLSVCCQFPEQFPKLSHYSCSDYVKKWLKKYFNAYKNRPSNRISKKIGTVPDKIINTIISARLPHLNSENISQISSAHRLSMSAENILGLLLEEYLAENLSSYGWYCAWG